MAESAASFDPIERANLVIEALREAVHGALVEHERAGNPVAVWQDASVVWVSAAEALRQGNQLADSSSSQSKPPASKLAKRVGWQE